MSGVQFKHQYLARADQILLCEIHSAVSETNEPVVGHAACFVDVSVKLKVALCEFITKIDLGVVLCRRISGILDILEGHSSGVTELVLLNMQDQWRRKARP